MLRTHRLVRLGDLGTWGLGEAFATCVPLGYRDPYSVTSSPHHLVTPSQQLD